MTSLAQLLDDISTRAWADLTDGTANCADAARALREAARLFELLALHRLGEGAVAEERRRVVHLVSNLCRVIESPGGNDPGAEPGRLSELMAAAADAAATMSPALAPAERWALACALLDPVCACTGVVRELADTSALVDLARGLDMLRRWSRQCPPAAREQARLDWARPTTLTAGETAVSLLNRQMDRIAYQATTSDLHPSDARHLAAAGLHVAIYARPILSRLAETGMRVTARDISNDCSTSWFAVRDRVRNLIPTPRPTPWAPTVAEFATGLCRVFGPPDATIGGHVPGAELATAYRGLVNRLPELADALARAAVSWGSQARPVIGADAPISWRDHAGIERYAGISRSRIDPLVTAGVAVAAHAARRTSVILSAHADGSATRLGSQPHPHLAKAHLAEAGCAQPTPESRWRPLADCLDQQVAADAGWPVLARILDLAAGNGWDVTARLPCIASDLPTHHPATELAYRVLAECQLQHGDPGDMVTTDSHSARRVPTSPPSPQHSLARQTPPR